GRGGGMGGMGGQGMGGGFGGGMGGMGGMGGGMGGMGGGMGGMGGMGMGGMMRVEPDKPKKVNVAMVCLEHGKDDPTPKMKYKIVRLNEVNPSPVVQQICLALANRQVDQKVAQAAAWHIANELSWPELLNKPRYITQFNGVELFFNPIEIQSAVRLVSYANAEAMKLEEENAQQYQSPGQTGETVSVGEQLANGDK
ncbi:MAG: hypothetical protein ACK5YR_13480, partial [Pirellula sp.]